MSTYREDGPDLLVDDRHSVVTGGRDTTLCNRQTEVPSLGSIRETRQFVTRQVWPRLTPSSSLSVTQSDPPGPADHC